MSLNLGPQRPTEEAGDIPRKTALPLLEHAAEAAGGEAGHVGVVALADAPAREAGFER